MGLFSSRDRLARQQVTNARAQLDVENDRIRQSGRRAETPAWNAANDATAHAEDALPWWKRLGT